MVSVPDDPNPYAAPEDLGAQIPQAQTDHYEVRGKKLAVQVGAVLPARCIKTNEVVVPGENGKIKTVKLTWINPWWALLLFIPFGIGLLVLIFIYLTKTAKGTITVHLSNTAIRRKRIHLIVIFSLSFLLFGLSTISPAILLGGILLLMIGLLSLRYLSPTGFQSHWFLVKGFHQDFLRGIDSQVAATTSAPGS